MADQYYFLSDTFWVSPAQLLLFAVSLFFIIFLRYLALSGLYEWFTRRARKKRAPGFHRQFVRELQWSLLSSCIFTALSVLMYYCYQQDLTKVYTETGQYGLLYFILSIALYLVLYETYYYWLHRWMHRPRIFRIVHKVHHESMNTSAFTSFSFHPLEAFLQFIFLPVMVFVIPIHYLGLAAILMFMTVSAIVNHAGIEIYPQRFYRHAIGKWLIGSSHHDLHHKEFRTNYGLYFTFWDKWMRTESDRYQHHFDENTLSRSRSQHHPLKDDRRK